MGRLSIHKVVGTVPTFELLKEIKVKKTVVVLVTIVGTAGARAEPISAVPVYTLLSVIKPKNLPPSMVAPAIYRKSSIPGIGITRDNGGSCNPCAIHPCRSEGLGIEGNRMSKGSIGISPISTLRHRGKDMKRTLAIIMMAPTLYVPLVTAAATAVDQRTFLAAPVTAIAVGPSSAAQLRINSIAPGAGGAVRSTVSVHAPITVISTRGRAAVVTVGQSR